MIVMIMLLLLLIIIMIIIIIMLIVIIASLRTCMRIQIQQTRTSVSGESVKGYPRSGRALHGFLASAPTCSQVATPLGCTRH